MRGAYVLVGLAALAVGTAYGGTLENGFHFDDGHSIQDNVYLEDLRYVPRYFHDITTFSPLAENRSYRPVLLIGFALSEWMGSGAPWAYHVLTLLLHAAGAVIVGLLVRRLLIKTQPNLPLSITWAVAGFCTVLFSVHPLVSEPVNYISSRSSLQAAVLAFAAVLLYIRSRQNAGRTAYAGCITALLLALLTKLTAVTVPALAVVWELTVERTDAAPWRARAKRIAPLFVIAGAFAVVHETIVGGATRAARSDVTPYRYFLTESRVWQRFMGLFVWPEDLCADLTMRWSQTPWDGPTARALLFAAILVTVAAAVHRRFPITAFGIAWFYITLAPTNSIVPLAEPASEHRVYIALPGLIFVAAEGLAIFAHRLGRRGRVLLALAAAVITGALAVRAHLRSRVWKDDVSLWGSVIACAPDNGRAHLNYGRGKWAAGEPEAARASFEKCKALWPRYAYCDINLAALALQEKRLDDAARHAADGRRLAPNNVYAQVWVGKVALAQARPAVALLAFARAQAIAPGYAPAEQGHAVAAFELGRFDEAARALRPHAEAGTLDAEGWFAWGFMRERAGDFAPAEAAYQHALRLDPRNARARYNLARRMQLTGRLDPAIAHYQFLVRLGSPPPEVLHNLQAALRARDASDERP